MTVYTVLMRYTIWAADTQDAADRTADAFATGNARCTVHRDDEPVVESLRPRDRIAPYEEALRLALSALSPAQRDALLREVDERPEVRRVVHRELPGARSGERAV